MVLDEEGGVGVGEAHVGVLVLAGEAEGGLPGDVIGSCAGGDVAVRNVLVYLVAEGKVLFIPPESFTGVAQIERTADVVACIVINAALSVIFDRIIVNTEIIHIRNFNAVLGTVGHGAIRDN